MVTLSSLAKPMSGQVGRSLGGSKNRGFLNPAYTSVTSDFRDLDTLRALDAFLRNQNA